MWKTKTFTTRHAMQEWIDKYDHIYDWHEIFVNNGFGVEFKKFRIVY